MSSLSNHRQLCKPQYILQHRMHANVKCATHKVGVQKPHCSPPPLYVHTHVEQTDKTLSFDGEGEITILCVRYISTYANCAKRPLVLTKTFKKQSRKKGGAARRRLLSGCRQQPRLLATGPVPYFPHLSRRIVVSSGPPPRIIAAPSPSFRCEI